jgi:type IV pilus assembly protein PilF
MNVALEEVREAMRADPGYGPAYNVAGLIYAELKEDKLAQENFQRALRLNPLDSDANNNYGRFLCDRQREDEAIRYFQAALRNPLYQTPDRSYVNAGLCSQRRGNTAAAEDYFQKALKARPNQPQALYQLADLAYARGAYDQAKDYLNRFGQLANANAEVLWLALRVERKLGDRAAAASYGTQLTKNYPESKEARALLAGRDE